MSRAMHAPTALVLDWDGTLVDNWPVIHAAMNETLVAFGHRPWTLPEAMEKISRSQRDSFPVLFGEHWRDARALFYRSFEARHLTELVPLAGAEELIKGLSSTDVTLVVVSNKRGDYLRREAEHLGWTRYFHSIVGATDAEADKPDRAPLLLALAGSGVDLSRDVWMVGDSATDMLTARAADCTAVLVRYPGASPVPLPEGVTADIVVDDLTALGNLVRQRRCQP